MSIRSHLLSLPEPTPEQLALHLEWMEKTCSRLGLEDDDYTTLCALEQLLHRWHEAECNGEIQWEENETVPYGYTIIRGEAAKRDAEPLPNYEARATEDAIAIAARYGLKVYVQTDPRGCALHLYADADLDGRDIEECYSSRAAAVMFPRC